MKFGKMKTHRRNRVLLVCLLLLTTGAAVGFALLALNQNLNLFYAPAQVIAGEAPRDQPIRVGGMVLAGSLNRSTTDLGVRFVISDLSEAEVEVRYVGILPDLFREGQGVIAHGRLQEDGVFYAAEILAKHDENYMPPELRQELRPE